MDLVGYLIRNRCVVFLTPQLCDNGLSRHIIFRWSCIMYQPELKFSLFLSTEDCLQWTTRIREETFDSLYKSLLPMCKWSHVLGSI